MTRSIEDEIPRIIPNTADEKRKTQLFTAESATDVDDARELLGALGLLEVIT